MKLGIDFGTTRTAVAVADRGNYPLVSFQSDNGSAQPWYPGLIAVRGDSCVFGLEAWDRLFEPGWTILRSLKRCLMQFGPHSPIRVGEFRCSTLELMVRYLNQLRQDLCNRSNLELAPAANLEALISVPANANSNQRFITIEAFRQSGFRVAGVVNEPSAAGIEYSHRYGSRKGQKDYLVVYDLGGGTFDTSVIQMKDRHYEVLADEGITHLGGDDFDELLLELALSRLDTKPELEPVAREQLLEECRRQKEGLHPNTRRMTIDLGGASAEAFEPVTVTTDEFYLRCTPLIEQTISAVERAVGRSGETAEFGWKDVASIYVVGGASDLPAVARMLRARYGRRVRRSPYPSGATAIGLAIAADASGGFALQELFSRCFGVWREAEAGKRIVFDPIFPKGTSLPRRGEESLVRTRTYHPAHNIAHFCYLECGRLNEAGEPCSDLTPWDEVFFALDPALRDKPSLDQGDVVRTREFEGQIIEERYTCDPDGVIEVTIANRTGGYERRFRLRQPGHGRVPET
jgi:molecular chaperone DnaK (HSP70)